MDWNDGLMLVGAAAALAGVYLLLGLAWLLIVGGLLVGGYGVVRDLCL